MDKVLGGAVKLNSGYFLPLMGYGTYCLTGNQVLAGLDAALKCGYRLIDTALMYQNEEEIGAALQTLLPKHGLTREDVFITTKLHPCGREEAKRIVESAFKKLQTDYIDLYLVHWPGGRMKETYLVLEEFKEAGKIRSIGVSSYGPRDLEEIKQYSSTVPAVNQCELHPLHTSKDTLEKCKQMGVHFQAFTSLARNNPALVEKSIVKEIAKQHNAMVTQVLLAYGLCQGASVIPKSGNPDRIKSNFEAMHVKLTQQQIEALSALNENRVFDL